jgi:hypothetical protein
LQLCEVWLLLSGGVCAGDAAVIDVFESFRGGMQRSLFVSSAAKWQVWFGELWLLNGCEASADLAQYGFSFRATAGSLVLLLLLMLLLLLLYRCP